MARRGGFNSDTAQTEGIESTFVNEKASTPVAAAVSVPKVANENQEPQIVIGNAIDFDELVARDERGELDGPDAGARMKGGPLPPPVAANRDGEFSLGEMLGISPEEAAAAAAEVLLARQKASASAGDTAEEQTVDAAESAEKDLAAAVRPAPEVSGADEFAQRLIDAATTSVQGARLNSLLEMKDLEQRRQRILEAKMAGDTQDKEMAEAENQATGLSAGGGGGGGGLGGIGGIGGLFKSSSRGARGVMRFGKNLALDSELGRINKQMTMVARRDALLMADSMDSFIKTVARVGNQRSDLQAKVGKLNREFAGSEKGAAFLADLQTASTKLGYTDVEQVRGAIHNVHDNRPEVVALRQQAQTLSMDPQFAPRLADISKGFRGLNNDLSRLHEQVDVMDKNKVDVPGLDELSSSLGEMTLDDALLSPPGGQLDQMKKQIQEAVERLREIIKRIAERLTEVLRSAFGGGR